MFGGVDHFAAFGIVDESLKVLLVFLDHETQTFPVGFVTLSFPHHPSVWLWLRLARNRIFATL